MRGTADTCGSVNRIDRFTATTLLLQSHRVDSAVSAEKTPGYFDQYRRYFAAENFPTGKPFSYDIVNSPPVTG